MRRDALHSSISVRPKRMQLHELRLEGDLCIYAPTTLYTCNEIRAHGYARVNAVVAAGVAKPETVYGRIYFITRAVE